MERKTTALKQTLLTDFWDNAPCGFHLLDAEGRILEINRTELAWMGRSKEDVLQRPIYDFYTAQSRERFKHNFPLFLQHGRIEGLEFELVARDGSIRHVSLSASVVRDADGVFQGSRSVMNDITELVLTRTRLSELVANQDSMLQALRQKEAALHESEFRWKFAVEGTGEGVWDWNVLTGETSFSHQWRSLIGYADDEIPSRFEEWRNRVHPQDMDRVMAAVDAYLQSGEASYSVDFRMQCKDGAYCWIASRGMAVTRDAGGRPLRIIGTHKDISERMLAKQRLEQSEERLRVITDNMRTVMFLKDLDGRYLYVNRPFEELFHISTGDDVGKTDFDIFPHAMAERFRQNDQWVFSTGQTFEVEEDAPHHDGVHTYLSVKVPIRDHSGKIYALCGMSTDITERKRMEHEVRIAAVAFDTSIATMVTDGNTVILRVNKAFEDSTGFSAAYAVGRTPQFLRSGKHDDAFYADMWKSIRETGSWQGEIWGRRKNKEPYPKWLSISAVRDEVGRISHYVGTESDISERKNADAALRLLNETLQDKKAQLRELVAQNEAARERERKHIAREVHDELGQVLTALRMDTSFIAMRFGTLEPALNAKVLGMRALVDTAIQGVRNVASNLRPVALDMGLYLALDWLCNDFMKRTGIACALDTKDQQVVLDEARSIVVFRIVQESLTNISRYAHASRVLVTLGLNGNVLGVEVQDDGQGFDPGLAEKVKTFGLLGMQERALALGGQLDVVSSPGQGTTIGLSIPYEQSMDGSAE
jgi:PAS domain S-box-containing protein